MATTGVQAPREEMFAETPEAVFGGEDIGSWDAQTFTRALALGVGSVPRAARLGVGLWAELGRVAMGVSKVEAARGDWRFADAAWNENPGYQRMKQAYLAWSQAMMALAEDPKADWRTAERARFAMTVLTIGRRPDQLLPSEPCRPQAGLRYRGKECDPWRSEFSPGLAPKWGHACPGARGRLQGRGGPGGYARGGRLAGRAMRAHTLRADDAESAIPPCGRCHPSDQQVLLS